MSSNMAERSLPIEIDTGSARAMTFSANSEHLLVGGSDGVHIWRVKDGELMATMEMRSSLLYLAVSRDGKWIVAGGYSRSNIVWDATTYKRVSRYREDQIYAVDVSPDSTRFVGSTLSGAVVLNLPDCEQVQTIKNDDIQEAKYSPQGDRIATASRSRVQVWDSSNARLLVDIPVHLTSRDNDGLVWFNDHLLVVSDSTIKRFDASTGSEIAEWQVPIGNWHSQLAMSNRGAFIAHATERTLTLWDTSTYTRLAVNDYPDGLDLIALSSDDKFLAIKKNRKISIESLPRIINSIPLSRLHPSLQEPDIQLDDDVLDQWKHDQLVSVEALLTRLIVESSTTSNHHLLASRALVRARLQQWDAALVDAEMAINLQPSVIGYIAKGIAFVGQGERHKGYHACDVAFERFRSSHGTFILLMKAIIIFIAGEHHDAISRVDDLIATVHFNWMCHAVQAYMYLLLGNSHMERGDYEAAIHSFELARTQMQHYGGQPLVVFSLISGWKFDDIGAMIRRCLCEALDSAGRTKDGVKWFYQMATELAERNLHRDHLQWAHDFTQRSCEKLEHLGDAEMDAERFEEAVSHYTTALSLDPTSPRGILLKRKKAFTAAGTWERALDDANKAIMLNPSSPWGYEMKHAALHRAGNYGDAVDAFEAMLSRITESPEQDVQQYGDQFISPSNTRATIRKIVQRTIRHIPRVLISTSTGRLCDKMRQASAFESVPIFNELVSSMTTRINYVRIKHEVRQFFRYAMLSHRWEENEPLFQQVANTSVYTLEKSPTHNKLRVFCNIVRDVGFEWAWSDTCCINKSDNFVLQEALVAMFRWYQCAALVIVFLRGVRSWSQLGALVASIWNTRAWTLQEYIAARVIRFYTEDWTPYLNLESPNHKESPEIISEMEKATGVSAQKLKSLRPGLTSIREKLRLASTRQTTLEEDVAYSLLGIFSVTGLPAIYGEGNGSLGRLLAHVLTVSGDASILAWTGESGSFNSCLPAHITVFDELAISHLPPSTSGSEMEKIITSFHSPSFDLDVALRLHHRLSELPAAGFAASRMKLPCIAFELPSLSSHRTRSGFLYRANTVGFGMVEIKTRHDLSRMQPLYLIHPWLDTVLDRGAMHRSTLAENDTDSPPTPDTDDGKIFDEEFYDDKELSDEGSEGYYSATSEPELPSLPVPYQAATLMDKETRARQLVVRLRQPFGALLLTLASEGRIGIDYVRVAADSMITVQFQESVSLADLLDNVRTFDVL